MGVLEIIFIMAGLGGRSGFAEITRQLATAKGEPGMQVLEIKSLLAGLGGRTAALEITL